MTYRFETVDVFTERRFGGNQLAVFPDARGISDEDMQALAAEFNFSETTFVLPPADPANTARMRIFNRTTEMDFAGHPSIGTAYVMARGGLVREDSLRLEVPAGIVAVEMERDAGDMVVGGRLTAPQTLSLGPEIPTEIVAACIGLSPEDVVTTRHPPVEASCGNPYVVAEVGEAALSRAEPDRAAFRRAREAHRLRGGRFALCIYAGRGPEVRMRMFAPLAGTIEDPATGSAATPLGALLLSLGPDRERALTIRQGEEMGRPSVLRVTASRGPDGIVATVAGRCVPVTSGEARLD